MKNKNISVKKGTCIHTELPFAYVLKSKYRTERCDSCLKANEKLMKCGGCLYVQYCSKVCQTDSWNEHKGECPHLKSLKNIQIPDAPRLIARIIRKLRTGGDMEKGYYSDHGYRKFRDLMSHYPEIKRDEKRLEHFEAITVVLKSLLGTEMMPNENELMGIFGRLCTNGFNILDPEMNSIGTGIFLGVSIIDHNCQPNAVATFEGTKLSVRLLEDIPCFDWSQIFISYIDLMNTREDRRHELKSHYYFLCTCTRCVDPRETDEMLSAACPNKQCDEFVIISASDEPAKRCVKCDHEISNQFVDQYKDTMTFTQLKLEEMKHTAFLDVLQLCLKKQAGVLHPLNIWHLKTLDAAFESAINMQKWPEALEYGIKALPGFRKYNGPKHPLLGINLMKIGKIHLYLGHPKAALPHLEEAATILRVTHGDRHSLYREQLMPLFSEARAITNGSNGQHNGL